MYTGGGYIQGRGGGVQHLDWAVMLDQIEHHVGINIGSCSVLGIGIKPL